MNIPYVSEYTAGQLFWDVNPGSFVRRHGHRFNERDVVFDLGAGEGKNACYIAGGVDTVVAVEPSRQALLNMGRLPQFNPERILRVQTVAEAFLPTHLRADGIVAYGLLHCFPRWQLGTALIQRMIAATRPGGIHILAVIVQGTPLNLDVHPYLKANGLPPAAAVLAEYKDHQLLDVEEQVITETHPTSLVEHQHSILRVAARIQDLAQ